MGPRGAQVGGPKPEILGPQKIQKIKILKIKIRSAQNVGKVFYAGKKRPRPIWGPPGQFFAWAGKKPKMTNVCLFSLVGPWALFTRFGALAAIHPRWGNRYWGTDWNYCYLYSSIGCDSTYVVAPAETYGGLTWRKQQARVVNIPGRNGLK